MYDIQQKNKLKQTGLLKRFTIKCDGTQATRESMKKDRSDKFLELKDKKNTAEYEIWFLNTMIENPMNLSVVLLAIISPSTGSPCSPRLGLSLIHISEPTRRRGIS